MRNDVLKPSEFTELTENEVTYVSGGIGSTVNSGMLAPESMVRIYNVIMKELRGMEPLNDGISPK